MGGSAFSCFLHRVSSFMKPDAASRLGAKWYAATNNGCLGSIPARAALAPWAALAAFVCSNQRTGNLIKSRCSELKAGRLSWRKSTQRCKSSSRALVSAICLAVPCAHKRLSVLWLLLQTRSLMGCCSRLRRPSRRTARSLFCDKWGSRHRPL